MAGPASELLARARGVRVICLGDVMLDRYVYGAATRISPEAPVPVVHVRRQVLVLGGAGNVANNLEALGLCPTLLSVVGDDANAGILENLLANDRKAAGFFILRDPSRPTTVKTRVIAGIQQVVRFDEEDTFPLSDAMNSRLAERFGKLLAGADGVAISDYAKGVVNPALVREAIRMSAAAGVPVAVDPKGRDYGKYAGADLVKPNRKELAEAAGMDIPDETAAAEAGRALMARHDIKNLLVTLSEKGMLLLRRDGAGRESFFLPSRAREVFDVTGAGDTVLAAMLAALSTGDRLETGVRLASLAAGLVVGKIGAASATVEEVEKAEDEAE
ncbi:MAG: PfkB family carbohydrate kinase [Planctomycetota bacterium]|jgi:D-beta-D-heptose 7-phosphate kinase/D-beta-D-heptose 1-phosphate adenosyltransferase|nr:PfkB family carbohydrate kinase [Planctomycetota bacterium]